MTAGAELFVERTMDAPVVHDLGPGRACVFSAACPGLDQPNEDAAAVVALDGDAAAFVLADGMGGGAAGGRASAVAVRAVLAALERCPGGDPQAVRGAILNGIEEANRAIREFGVGAATTLAIVEVRGREIRPYHVGDSLILVVGGRGRVKLQNVPHSPVGYGVEAGLLDEGEAMLHEQRHVVSNMVGTPEMRIEVGARLRLAERDTVLLASDGLSDNLRTEEIVQRLRRGGLYECAERLAIEARRRMTGGEERGPSKPDDLTVIAYRPRRAR